MNETIHISYRRFGAVIQRLGHFWMAWMMIVLPVLADTTDDDSDDYDPLPRRTKEQIEALIFNFDEVVETIILYTALFALLVMLLSLAASMRLRRWVGYTLLCIVSLAWFVFSEQHATGIFWVGLSPPIWLLTVIGTPIISAHFLLAGWYVSRTSLRAVLIGMATLPPVALGVFWSETETPMPLIILALLGAASHLLTMPRFDPGPRHTIYTRRNGVVVVVALVLSTFVVFGELDEGFDASFAIRSLFVVVVLLFAFFLVQSVITILRDRDASQRQALQIAQREAEQAKSLLEAEKKYARAKEAARRHTLRLATASHDIRQPITSLRATMAAVAKDQPDDVQHQLKKAFDYLDQLAKSYMETDEPPNAPAPEISADGKETLSAKLLCATLERMFREEAEAKGLQFGTEVEDQHVRAQPLVLTRILSNLISNAIQHTQDGKVMLAAAATPDGFCFSVRNSSALPDTGEELFTHGVKGDASDGSGFGLAIIQQLCAANGLTLDWQSDTESGTVFSLTIPAD